MILTIDYESPVNVVDSFVTSKGNNEMLLKSSLSIPSSVVSTCNVNITPESKEINPTLENRASTLNFLKILQ